MGWGNQFGCQKLEETNLVARERVETNSVAGGRVETDSVARGLGTSTQFREAWGNQFGCQGQHPIMNGVRNTSPSYFMQYRKSKPRKLPDPDPEYS